VGQISMKTTYGSGSVLRAHQHLYRAQDAQQPFQTLFTDEADGPLDPERKRAFMKMKREVLRVGGYEREYFISQTPDLVDDADGVIDVVALALQ
ncbi:hypothetical protein, partial [Cupriavidus pauculus]